MGLDSASVKFLCAAKSTGVDFTNTVMIGRQSFHPDAETLQRVFSVLGIARNAHEFLRENKHAEEFFALLGAKQIASVDASDYEGASHICDMNEPIPNELRERFSVVHDGGSLEHIFNIPQALKNCMEMVKVGGHFTQVNEANNFMGHGFWQLSPELIYRVFSPNNGYRVEVVLLHEVIPGGSWYLVFDPAELGRRVELCNRRPTYILTVARRLAITNIFACPPQQSDYVSTWNRSADGETHPVRIQPARRPAGLRRLIPGPVKRVLKTALERFLLFVEPSAFRDDCYRHIEEDVLLRGSLVNIKPPD